MAILDKLKIWFIRKFKPITYQDGLQNIMQNSRYEMIVINHNLRHSEQESYRAKLTISLRIILHQTLELHRNLGEKND
jgi:hypothetical protein